ncbi:hypothetical protein HAX54_039898 [Datura stramonium]|uniref:Uncharacterized protein n=1 Tax=Datura stramonium TaxID=4076 RepID=A0ABS8SKL0_DATST|nr:hypothetical protein [Datura stramonium]
MFSASKVDNEINHLSKLGILRDLSKVSTTGAQEHSVKFTEQNNGEANGSDAMAAAGIITSDDEIMVLPSER